MPEVLQHQLIEIEFYLRERTLFWVLCNVQRNVDLNDHCDVDSQAWCFPLVAGIIISKV